MIEKLTIVGPAYPYRGGLATILETLARTFRQRGTNVDLRTFTLQYPSFLFPGKSQYREGNAPADLNIVRSVSTVNPFNWIRVGRKISRQSPDVVLLKYWTPFMAPCFGTIARIARSNGHTRVVVQLDNITPHEHHFVDRPLNSYFLNSCDGFVYMSDEVKRDLNSYRKECRAVFSPHPLFTNYGAKVSKREACEKLELDPVMDYSLFFGYIRDYKGLDILLDAWALMKCRGNSSHRRLIVAGEFYGNGAKYYDQIDRNGLRDDVVLRTDFIPDEQVRYYFSAADLVIQPYHSATQSGVTQVAYNFNVPMIVTDVGGLAEIVPDNVVGYVCNVSPESVAEAIERAYKDDNLERMRGNMAVEKRRFSWEAAADAIESAAGYRD